ncbi:MAG TPA: urea carboxylase-associated family protein [Solirubrobacteraceae bacterium]
MAIVLRLTDYQLAVVDRLCSVTGADPDELAAAAVASERGRPPDPRWRQPRPQRGASAGTVTGIGEAPPVPAMDLTLPAASGGAVVLSRGDHLRIEQLGDGQGVDLRAYTPSGVGFNAGRTRAAHGINPSAGATLWAATAPDPLLTIVADSAPGHDLCFPACSELEYAEYAGIAGHLGCTELHRAASAAAGLGAVPTADVLNLWLPTAVSPGGRLRFWPAACRTGDFVTLRADADAVVTLSCCPDDLFGTSQYEPKPARVSVISAPHRPDDASRAFGWPAGPPASALARYELPVTLADEDLAYVDQWVTRGWLGTDRAAVARALVFRLYEFRHVA